MKLQSQTLQALVSAIEKGMPYQSPALRGRCICCGYETHQKRGTEEFKNSLNAIKEIDKTFKEHFGDEAMIFGTTLEDIKMEILKDLNISGEVTFTSEGVFLKCKIGG